MSAGAKTTAPEVRRAVDRGLVLLSATLLVGATAALLDTTVVVIALDDLQREFGATVSQVQWVTTSYLLSMAAVIPVVGWTVGRFGARAVWAAAIALFMVGSFLCGLAPSVEGLIFSRVVQGVGGGMVLPLTQLVLAREAGPDRLGRVMSVVVVIGQFAPFAGPVFGGALIEALGWRWIFFVNAPLCLVSLAMTWRWFPRDGHRKDSPLDVLGLVLLPTATVALIHGLSNLDAAPKPSTWFSLAAGAALLAAFVVRSVRRSASGAGATLLDLGLFARRPFAGATAMMFVLGLTIWGPMFLLPLYYQQQRGLGALEAGLMLAPQSAGLALALLPMAYVADRVAPRPLALAGMAVASLGTFPFAFASEDTNAWLLAATLFVRGVGFGIADLPITVALYKWLRPEEIADATSASSIVQRVGAAAGTALMAIVLEAGAGDGAAPTADAFQNALTWMLALTAAGLVAAACLLGRRTGAPPEQAPVHPKPDTAPTGARKEPS